MTAGSRRPGWAQLTLATLLAFAAIHTTGCTEGGLPLSLRGEWQMTTIAPGEEGGLNGDEDAAFARLFAQAERETAVGETQNIILPADLTDAVGLAGRPGWVLLRKRLPRTIDRLFQKREAVALNLGMASDVFRIYLNTTPAGGRGQAEPYRPGYFRTLAVDLPGYAAYRDGRSNFISILIYTRGEFPVSVLGPAFEIGEAKTVYAIYYRGEIIVFALLTIYFIIGAYHLLLVSRRPKELYNLYFGLFTVFLAGYWFFDTELRGIVFGDAVIAGMLTEHVILYNLGPVFLLFLSHLFYRRHSRLALVLWGIFLFMCVVALLGTFPIQRLMLKIWQAGVVPLMLYIIFYVFRAWRQGRPDAGFLVFGVLFFLAATLHDIMYNAGVFRQLAAAIPGLPEYIPPVSVASKAFLLVVLGVAGTLANRFARVHTESERLNVELEDRVHARTRELREAKRETDDILDTVQEGLFLLYKASGGGLTTGVQYSRRLEEILGQRDIGSRNFMELIGPMLIDAAAADEAPDGSIESIETIDAQPDDSHEPTADVALREPADILEALKKYLDLMFAGKLSEKMLAKLNPLRDITLQIADGERRDLQFSFYRLQSDAPDSETGDAKKDPQLMAVVIDVTRQKELARNLLREREKSEAERTRLYAVLRTDPRELAGFIRDCEVELESARSAFTAGDRDAVFRSVHAMKGDAGMLELQFFAERAHRCESLLENQNREDAMAPQIERGLADLESVLGDIREDLERMKNFRAGFGEKSNAEDATGLAGLIRGLGRLADRMSARLEKPVKLQTDEFAGRDKLWQRLSSESRGVIRDALIQLVRNSLVHGLESPEKRAAEGKPPVGEIRISLADAPDRQVLIGVRDDGQGLNLEKLREKARDMQRWSPEEIANWADKDVAALIFTPGLSTAGSADGDAGRGVGMDLVRERVRGAGGRIETRFAPGRYCEFRLRMPEHSGA